MTDSKTPRTVLYVENGIGYGGAIICLQHLARNLDPQRYRAILVTGRTGPEYQRIAEVADWHHIRDRYFDPAAWSEKVSAAVGGIPVIGFLARQVVARSDDVINFLPFFTRLLWLALRSRPALIHANNEPLCNRAAILVGRLLGIPVISHVRGPQTGSQMMHWLYRAPDCFISVSHWVDREIGALGVPECKRNVIYDGIELDQLDPDADGSAYRQRLNLDDSLFCVGLVGLLIPWKGQQLLLDAAPVLRERIPNLRLLFVGGTPDDCTEYEAELRARVAREGLEDIVVFAGHTDDIQAAYNSLDVVLSASLTPEPLGTMVIECMTMAQPLIAPNHGGGAEMTSHGETSLLFEPGNAQDLAAQILRLYEDPELARTLGRNARDKALKTFAVAEHARQVQALYDRLLQGPLCGRD